MAQKEDTRTKLLTASPFQLMLSLSVPAIIGMVVVGLYSFMDRVFVGQLIDKVAMGAVSVAYPFTLVNTGVSTLIGMGYPNWWYSCPMAVVSFLESYDFSDKQVYLFCSHGTGGLAASVQDIKEILPDGQISENVFDTYEEDTASSQEEIGNWLGELGY